jgi:Phage integrase, N-terminal SAM-like domain
MSTDIVSPLRQRMIEDMNARKLGAGTQRNHIHSCKRFAAFLKRPPDTATAEDIRRFQLQVAETDVPFQDVQTPAKTASGRPSSKANHVGVLRGLVRAAVEIVCRQRLENA